MRPIPQATRQYEQPAPPIPPPPAGYEPEPDPDPYPRLRPPAEYPPPDEPYERAPSARDYPGQGYPPREEAPLDYQRSRDRRADRTNLIANTIHVVTALIAFVFVLHIVFTLFGANQNSGFVAFVYGVAKVFVFGFGDVFTPGSATIGLIANYGLAALVYLVVGRIVYRTLRRG
jgi:hypothetical protein